MKPPSEVKPPFERLGVYIAAHAGLRMPDWVLEARATERMTALGVRSCDDYVKQVTGPDNADELALLVESLRVGETSFFRHAAQIKALTNEVIPQIRRTAGPRGVRVWSAGCATGEEPYTLAMLLRRGLSDSAVVAQVLATDLSEEALAFARQGVYPASALEQVPPTWRRRSFVPCADGWAVAEPAARLVTFEQHNLTGDVYPRGFDLILCRNVLIYFESEARAQVLGRLIDSLRPGGFLFVGYAESLRDVDALEVVRTADGVLFRKPRTPARERVAPVARSRPAPRAPAPTPSRQRALVATTAIVTLHGRYADAERLSRELSHFIAGPHRRVEVHLDGADYLCDDAAAVLRRARSAARSAGIHMAFMTERPGIRRWMSRGGIDARDEGDHQ